MAKTSNNIDKRMSSGGEDLSPLDMNDFIKLADAEKIKADAETDLFEAIQKKFLEQKKPGESFNSWLNRTDVEELRRIELKDGSKVIDFAEDLTSKDKDLIKQLLKMSGVNVSE